MSQTDDRRAKRKPERRKHKTWTDERRRRRRELGQNFLRDARIASRIVEASGVKREDLVVEFGAGGGMLTRRLARAAREVVAVEYDPYWARRLEERFSGEGNVRVVRADALSVELPREPFRVVANVPFNATTAILSRLLDDPTTPPEDVHLLVQRQVALKHARATPTTLKTLNWSPWYRFSAGLEVPAESFDPEPRVDARLLVAAKRDRALVAPEHRHPFRALVRLAYEGRGNTVGRSLRPVFTRTQIRRLARDNGFGLGDYPSTLTVRQWAGIFAFMVEEVPRHRWPAARRPRGTGTKRR